MPIIPQKTVREEKFSWLIQKEFVELLPADLLLESLRSQLMFLLLRLNQSSGPEILSYYPHKHLYDLEEISSTTFMTSISVFGFNGKKEKVLINIPLKYIDRNARIIYQPCNDSKNDVLAFVAVFPTIQSIDFSKHDLLILELLNKYLDDNNNCTNKLYDIQEHLKEIYEKIINEGLLYIKK